MSYFRNLTTPPIQTWPRVPHIQAIIWVGLICVTGHLLIQPNKRWDMSHIAWCLQKQCMKDVNKHKHMEFVVIQFPKNYFSQVSNISKTGNNDSNVWKNKTFHKRILFSYQHMPSVMRILWLLKLLCQLMNTNKGILLVLKWDLVADIHDAWYLGLTQYCGISRQKMSWFITRLFS